MYESHVSFSKPESPDAKIWRYLDFTKFVSLLSSQTLFFTRSDYFRDKFEGQHATFNITNASKVYNDLDPEELVDFRKQHHDFNQLLRQHIVISCWHRNEFESAAMWDLYVKSNEGIAIQTTFEKLSNSFSHTEEKILMGEVSYIDFETEWMPEGNAFYPFFHKRKSFEHEREIRAIHYVFPKNKNPSPFNAGINIKVDVGMLIEKVYVSPEAPDWLSELVKEVLIKYELEKPVIHSKLYELSK